MPPRTLACPPQYLRGSLAVNQTLLELRATCPEVNWRPCEVRSPQGPRQTPLPTGPLLRLPRFQTDASVPRLL